MSGLIVVFPSNVHQLTIIQSDKEMVTKTTKFHGQLTVCF